jgi:DNA-binding CsgD family transcriptional regulator
MFRESFDFRSTIGADDALRLLELINGCLGCRTREDFAEIVLETRNLVSFDHAIAALGCHDKRRGISIAHAINISFPELWCVEYDAKDYIQADPVVKANFIDYSFQRWSVAKTRYHSRAQKEIAALCEDFGMEEGFTIGSSSSPLAEYGGMFCFSGLPRNHDKRTPAILANLVPHLHLAFARVSRSKGNDKGSASLTPREKEVLDWLKRGKSSWEISVILNISERTANYHIYNMMRKLDAVNRPQALAIATRLGLIDLD